MLNLFEKDNLRGMVNEQGKVIIEPEYDSLTDFIEGYALGYKNEKWVYINDCGKIVKKYNVDEMYPFNEGMAAMNLHGCIGFINKKFQVVIEPVYGLDSSDFHEGLAFVSTPNKNENELYGFINKKGEQVIDLKYDLAQYFSQGLASVSLNGKTGAIDKKGNVIIPFKYEFLNEFKEDRAIFINDETWGIIDKKGNLIYEDEFDEEEYDYYMGLHFNEGYIQILKNNKYSYMDINGNMATDICYDEASCFENGIAVVKLNGRSFAINKKFTIVEELNCNN